MIGTNTLHLCQATVMLALQEYLDRRWVPEVAEPRPTVTDVTARDSLFIVTLTVKEKES